MIKMIIQKFNISDKEFIGVDEVGRGSLIGPVITCAVYLNKSDFSKIKNIPYIINDSKKLSNKTRKAIYKWVNDNNIKYQIASASIQEIDELNIRVANNLAMNRAIFNLILNNSDIYSNNFAKDINCYIDGNYFEKDYNLWGYPSEPTKLEYKLPIFKTIIKGDASNIAIALASIIAKEYRDELIINLGKQLQFKKYKWNCNMGYGTAEHLNSILLNGITIHHRLSFLKKLIYKKNNEKTKIIPS
jgi:ribonuclease HII